MGEGSEKLWRLRVHAGSSSRSMASAVGTNTQQLRPVVVAALGLSAVQHAAHPAPRSAPIPKAPCFAARRGESRERSRSPLALSGLKTSPVLARRCDATLRCSLRLLRLGTYHHTASPAHPCLPDGTGGLLLGQQEGKGGKGEEGESECRRRLADNCF